MQRWCITARAWSRNRIYRHADAGLDMAGIYCCGWLGMVINGHLSDRNKEVHMHTAVAAAIGAIGLLLTAFFLTEKSAAGVILSLALSAAGTMGAIPTFWRIAGTLSFRHGHCGRARRDQLHRQPRRLLLAPVARLSEEHYRALQQRIDQHRDCRIHGDCTDFSDPQELSGSARGKMSEYSNDNAPLTGMSGRSGFCKKHFPSCIQVRYRE